MLAYWRSTAISLSQERQYGGVGPEGGQSAIRWRPTRGGLVADQF